LIHIPAFTINLDYNPGLKFGELKYGNLKDDGTIEGEYYT
jgi:hypothetical protein